MADPQLCKYLAPITLVSGANAIVINDGSGNHTVTITAGTYYISGDGTASDLLYQLKTAFDTASAAHCTWTVDLDASNKVQFHGDTSASGAWHVDFSSGSTTFDEAILGHTAADLTAADHTAASCTYVSPYVWYATEPVQSDTFMEPHSPTVQNVAKSGRVWTVQEGEETETRLIVHANEPFYCAMPLTSATYTNRDWQSFWTYCNAGQSVRFYPDVTVTGAYVKHSTPKGYQTYVFDEATCTEPAESRLAPGVALYSWTVGLRKYV